MSMLFVFGLSGSYSRNTYFFPEAFSRDHENYHMPTGYICPSGQF